jgi:hypothetical protein
MRRLPIAGALATAAWIAAAAGIYFRADPAPGPRAPSIKAGGPGDDAHYQNYFRKEEGPDFFLLTYGFSDFEDRSHRLSFRMARRQIEEAGEEYGYVLDDLNRHLDASLLSLRAETVSALEALASERIRESGMSGFISIEKSDPAGQAFKLKVSAPPERSREVKAEFDRITRALAVEQEKRAAGIEKEYRRLRRDYLERRGLRFQGEALGIDYGLSVRRNRPRMQAPLEALEKAARGLNLLEFLSRILAFVQEIRYGLPPLEENGRYIFEFWPPPRVLVENLGDCDSKGVAFASLWTLYRSYPLLLIKIPNHMLVGVAVPAYSGQGVRINGLRYTLMEVTGPGKYPPGLLFPRSRTYLEGGKYLYEMIR